MAAPSKLMAMAGCSSATMASRSRRKMTRSSNRTTPVTELRLTFCRKLPGASTSVQLRR